MNSSFYPSAAENQITLIEDRALAGRHGALRLIKMNFDPGGLRRWMESSRGGFVLIADLYLRSGGGREAGPGNPVDIVGDQAGAIKPIVSADGDTLRSDIGCNDV